MSSWFDVYSGLRNNLVTQLSGIVPAKNISIGFPSDPALLNTGQPNAAPPAFTSKTPIVAVYDRGYSKDVTRWIPRFISDWNITAPAITFSQPSVSIPPLGSGNVTVLTSPQAGDTAAVTLQGNTKVGATTSFTSAVTPTQAAAQIVAAVNSGMSGVLSAVSSTATVTFTNLTNQAQVVGVTAANMASALFEVHRVKRNAQIIAFANSPQKLDTVGEPISQMLGTMEVYYGYTLPDGSMVRVVNAADACTWDNVLNNLARRDWLVDLEYGVTLNETGYEVLAAIGTIVAST